YPVHGGNGELEQILTRLEVSDLVMASPSLSPLRRAEITRVCGRSGVRVVTFAVQWNPEASSPTDPLSRLSSPLLSPLPSGERKPDESLALMVHETSSRPPSPEGRGGQGVRTNEEGTELGSGVVIA